MATKSARPVVWLVDDSALEGELSRRALADEFDVEVFCDGALMLERLATGFSPTTLVVDWHMPELSGLDICLFLRKSFDRASLPILILTATGEKDALLTGLEAGANDYVQKPFKPSELSARVSTLVERKQRNDQFLQDAALRERFIGILGHDLRQPLNTFALGTRLLLSQGLSESQAKTVQRMVTAADRMKRMISDMLDLTQSRTGGGLPIHRQDIDLREPCQLLVEELRLGHPGSAIEFVALGETRGLYDGDRIIQMCINLVANALEHGRPGEPILVGLQGGPNGVTLTVENHGEPIAPELMPRLFDPFRRGSETGREGLGLGLFIVDQIARSHQGSVNVVSEGERTAFAVTLPRVRARSLRSDD
jgi:two-component system sensor histidine kinase/response regulator